MTTCIALDGMGGDSRAIPNLQGAYHAVNRSLEHGKELRVLICGPQNILEEGIQQAAEDPNVKPEFRLDTDRFRGLLSDSHIEFIHAEQIVEMDESPSQAVRQKRESSMAKAFHLVSEAKADAAISAGNSGAMMAYGIAILKRIEGVKRPAILCHFPSQKGIVVMLDAGANVDCSSQHLEQFAQMGRIYLQCVFDVPQPRIALMNIGEEESKGNELVKATHPLLKDSFPENYVGFVEGRDLLTGKVDVIVCDGFVGNVALKTAEGVAKAVSSILKEELSRNPIWGLGAWLAKGGFMAMKNKLDYREYGAAPLIGLDGLGLISHGSSDGKAMASAIRMASLYVENGLMEKMRTGFGDHSNLQAAKVEAE